MTKKEKLKRAIMEILEFKNRRGWENGIKLGKLGIRIQLYYPGIHTGSRYFERTIRKCLASMPEVANCGNGYYLIETAEDLKKEEEMLINQYIIPLATKIRDKRAAHPELFPSPAQMSIFDSDFWDHVMMREGEIKKRKKGES